MNEKIIATAKAYHATSKSKGGSLVVVIPKQVANLLTTKFFLVKQDEKGRIIYEPIKQ